MSELDRVAYFIEGLKQHTKAKVNYKAPSTLEEAIQIAVNYDTAMFRDPVMKYQPRSNTYGQPRNGPKYKGVGRS